MTLFDPHTHMMRQIGSALLLSYAPSHSCPLYYFFKMRKRKFRDDEISLDRSHLDTKARTRALSGRSHFVVQSLSCSRFFVTSWTAALQAPLPFTVSWSLLKFISIESVMLSNHLILCHPLLHLPSIFPNIRVFSNLLALHIKWPKYWSFSFSISPSNEYSRLISFRTDWFDLLAVQGTLKSLQLPQFKGISFLALSFFYGPTLTSIHEYLENHSFDYKDLCWQSDIFDI